MKNRKIIMTKWPLMKDNMTLSDRVRLAKFCMTSDRFTNGPKVKQFESLWSEWIGSKYSLYVSSGSTANFLLIAAIKEAYGLGDGDKVIVPACTWVTNINPIFQLGLKPIFCDINYQTFSYCENDLQHIANIHPDIKLIFTTHLMGFPSNTEKYKDIFPNALFIDDVCESHGCLDSNGTKVGSNSLGATFSFYFGHHMSTIEGGMICTNNDKLYDLMKLKRSHGLARESDHKELYYNQYKHLNKEFLFVTDGYNFRNHELGAVLGISQLKRLDMIIDKRNKNYKKFIEIICKYDNKIYTPTIFEGISSFCFPLIFRQCEDAIRFKEICEYYGVEHRPIIGGNLLNQPYLFEKYSISSFKNNLDVDIIHNNGVYLGNNHFIGKKEFKILNKMLSKL
jgi:CDP-6-deoxy-D-xylo-4-hexulose-3-dehydrase